jgi:RNA polymerase sigma-70 factor (ECF subfamily)
MDQSVAAMSDSPQHFWNRAGYEKIFVSTVWSAVERAAKGDEQSQAELYQKYVYPIYCYLRRKCCSPEDSEDLVQTLFQRLFARDALASVSQRKGRLRTWLLRCVDNLLLDHVKTRGASKRGGGQIVVSLDVVDTEKRFLLEAGDPHSPERQFDRKWAEETMRSAMTRLAQEFDGANNGQRFAILRDLLGVGQSVPGEQAGHAGAAERLGISVQAVKSAVHRLRQRLRELIEAEVMLTVQSQDEVEEELQYLYQVLSS